MMNRNKTIFVVVSSGQHSELAISIIDKSTPLLIILNQLRKLLIKKDTNQLAPAEIWCSFIFIKACLSMRCVLIRLSDTPRVALLLAIIVSRSPNCGGSYRTCVKSSRLLHIDNNGATLFFNNLNDELSLIFHINWISLIFHVNWISFDFSELPLLTFLDMSNNKITEIFEKNFQKSTALLTLYLCHNRINKIAPKSFEKLLMMKTLDVSSNKLDVFKPEMFGGNLFAGNKLKKLNLSNNLLSILNGNVFAIFVNLGTLYLSGVSVYK